MQLHDEVRQEGLVREPPEQGGPKLRREGLVIRSDRLLSTVRGGGLCGYVGVFLLGWCCWAEVGGRARSHFAGSVS